MPQGYQPPGRAAAPARPAFRRRPLAALLAVQVGLAGGAPAPVAADPFVADPFAEGAAPVCRSVEARQALEEAGCSGAVRADLHAGRIGLGEALARLEECAGARADQRPLALRRAGLRAEWHRARLAFGEPLSPDEAREVEALAGDDRPAHSAVRRLRAAGLSPAGFRGDDAQAALERLRGSEALRGAVRDVFGERTADDLERLLDPAELSEPRAVVLGGSVIIPNITPMVPRLHPDPLRPPAERTKAPRVLSAAEYVERVSRDLGALEEARLRYLESAARSHRLTSSVRGVLRSIRRLGAADEQAAAAGVEAAMDYAVVLARLENLRLQLGVDPLLHRAAAEAVALAAETDRACEEVALRRLRWIYTGAGGVTGLMGAAGVVVATGATGTLAGGITIAAALEAALGMYLVAATERVGGGAASDEPFALRPEAPEPEPERRRYRMPERRLALDRGEAGLSRSAWTALAEAPGEWREQPDTEGEGEGEEHDAGDADGAAPRENRIPPVLPPVPPDELVQLPPLLDPAQARALPSLSFAEIQRRLDEFLALDAARPEPRPERPEAEASTVRALIEEAQAALRLWKERRELSPGFGEFFLRAEVEEAPASRRAALYSQARARFDADRRAYRRAGDLEQLRRTLAERLVTHCRADDARGDLVLAACSDPTALTILVVAAIQESGVALPDGAVLGVQSLGPVHQPVLFLAEGRRVVSLSDGKSVQGVAGPIHHPASFYYGYLVEHGVTPDIDPEQHLLIALSDPGMEPPPPACAPEQRRGGIGRVLDWLKGLVGIGVPSRRPAGCEGDARVAAATEASDSAAGEAGAAESGGGGSASDGGEAGAAEAQRGGADVNVSLGIPQPPIPLRGGGQAGGGGQGGGGQGSPGGASAGSSGGGGGGEGGAAGGQQGGRGGSSRSGAESGSGGDAGAGRDAEGASGGQAGSAGGGGSGAGAAGGSPGASTGQPDSTAATSASGGGGGSGGGESGRGGESAADPSAQAAGEPGPGGAAAASGGGSGGSGQGDGTGAAGQGGESADGASELDLGEVARETVELAELHAGARPLRIEPWRLRADEAFAAAPTARVLYADNDRALTRFAEGERFITMSPAEDEAQRRMLEADSYPLYPATASCASEDLPPRRVFRRVARGEAGFRYVFCDRDESLVIFRTREDARSYSRIRAPDRPLYLVRLAAETLEELERSDEVARLRAFLDDPDVLRGYAPEEVDSMASAAAAVLTFQHTLESALVQSMEELEASGVRGHYFELHRQVLQGAFFVEMAEAVHRLNRRLASDPLQALAWANALPPEARQGFFRLYHVLGGMMYWPERWATLEQRYAGAAPAAADEPVDERSLDFLQILSDPTRVRVDWRQDQRPTRATIRDREAQQGEERSPEPMPRPTESSLLEKQDTTERRRGGTRGLGRAGVGRSEGPERGQQPMQMISIRETPVSGEPDRLRLPDENPTRPGGTRGRKKQSEESASLQEPVLWVAPQTFVDAVLSTWDRDVPEPGSAGRVPPLLRFDPRLRQLFLSRFDDEGLYDGRLLAAMRALTDGGWLRYREPRQAMGGRWVRVRAFDTGRFSAKYSRTAPINDQDQIRAPNFFTAEGTVIPADLFEPLREAYTRRIRGIFDLAADPAGGEAPSLEALPPAAADSAGADRESLLRSLRLVGDQARARD